MMKTDRLCGMRLRTLCMTIGYLHLVSSVADIAYHMLTVAIVTNGFQCDVNFDILLSLMKTPFLEPILLVLNLGTHGFYPFPLIVKGQYNMYVDHISVSSISRCYPGKFHVYMMDVFYFFINLIWLRIVISYIGALHERKPEPMRMFFNLSIVKLMIQVLYLRHQPEFDVKVNFGILDILITIFFLIIVRKYTKLLKTEIASQSIEKPPPYIECLIETFAAPKEGNETYEKKEAIINVVEEKKQKEDSENNPK